MTTILELIKINKSYGKEKVKVNALKEVDLKTKAGEVTLIMGPSGSGKTTLLSISGCILKPTSGKVVLEGIPVSDIKDSGLAKVRKKKIGFIFQSFNLLPPLTAKENVMISLNLCGLRGRKASNKAKELLGGLGLERRLNHYPSELSGGEKQRVAIARALANEPSLILADEPTANLDSRAGHAVTELLRKIAKEYNSSIVIVSHDTRIVDIADRILLLEDGNLSFCSENNQTIKKATDLKKPLKA